MNLAQVRMSRSNVKVTRDKEKVRHFVEESVVVCDSGPGARPSASSTLVGKSAHAVQYEDIHNAKL